MLNSDFKEFAELLDAQRVEYLVVDGDIDFWLRASPDNIGRVLSALEQFGFGSLGLKAEDFAGDSVIQLGHPPRRIDLMTVIDGVSFDDCFARRERVELSGITLPFIGLSDLKTNKQASGRLKDLADLEALGWAPTAPDHKR